MNAISLFSGCGGDTVGMTKSGYKVVAYNEFNKAAIQSHILNFPDSKLLQDKSPDITKVPDSVFEEYKNKVELVFAGFPCFVAGTKVLTNSGYKNIEDVNLDDTLLTHTGKFQSIVNLQRKVYSGKLYELDIKYHPEIITCTEEHPFYVREKTKKWNNSERKYDIAFKKAEWKKASELTLNDYYGMVINTNNIIPEFTFEKKVNKNKKIKETIVLNDLNMYYMMGYFVGDGWIEETTKSDGRPAHKIRFAINNKDECEVLEKITKILPITDKKCDTGKCKKFGCANAIWHTILKQFGKYAHNKIIPEWIQDASKEYIQEFINGYMKADGNVCKDGSLRITTVSYNLAFGLQRLYLKLGHISSVQKTVRPKTYVIQGRTVNQRDTYNVNVYLDKTRKYTSFIEDNYVWFAPFKIHSKESTNIEVYNFEVENDNSYIVENTVVHNCQGFSRGGKRKSDDPRNQMYLQFVRVVKTVKPKFFIGENVTGLVSMKSGPAETDPLILDKIKKAFKDIGYDMTHQVVEATEFAVPQKRKRIILVGWREDVTFEPTSFWASVNSYTKCKMPKMRSFVTNSMEGAFEIPTKNVPDDFAQYALAVEQTAEPTGTFHPFVALKASASNETYNGTTYKSLLTCSKRGSPIHSEIIDLDRPCKTIICTYDHQPRLLVGLRKPDGTSYCRVLHPDELKQIQGFPSDYKIHGNNKEKVTQIGNAVPPPIIEAVSSCLKKYM
uniref:DNA (cytosine-5-)-methyltransferase n=1 Tax=viral metagenome TaxID=1070528 RepID=A0A6C0D6F7_9ZZZZ